MKFIGLPAVLLNNMIERYDKKMILDFKAFFCEEWCTGVLHDRFRKWFDHLHREIAAQAEVNTFEVHTKVRMQLMQFLIDNADLLPHYFTSESQIPPLPGDDDDGPVSPTGEECEEESAEPPVDEPSVDEPVEEPADVVADEPVEELGDDEPVSGDDEPA
jgi:hypothetical protein